MARHRLRPRAIGTLAAWSDTATATSGVFSTGSINLKLNGDDGNPTAYSFATLTKTNMLPNASVAATLPVQNTGTVPFSYAMYAAATSSPLAPYLKVTVSTGTSNGTVCSGARRSRPPSRWCREGRPTSFRRREPWAVGPVRHCASRSRWILLRRRRFRG
ncbi:hypothetical protein GS438_17995 [Rhodococcus hoagii]|nr:hypothetical protein [Prescottella equi]